MLPTLPKSPMDAHKAKVVLEHLAQSPLYAQLLEEQRKTRADRRAELLRALNAGLPAKQKAVDAAAARRMKAEAAYQEARAAERAAAQALDDARRDYWSAESQLNKFRDRAVAELRELVDERLLDVFAYVDDLHDVLRLAVAPVSVEMRSTGMGHRGVAIYNADSVGEARRQLADIRSELRRVVDAAHPQPADMTAYLSEVARRAHAIAKPFEEAMDRRMSPLELAA